MLIARDAADQEEQGRAVDERDFRPGDVVCYRDQVAFYAGGGRILHATGRAGVRAVVEEREPVELAARVRTSRRISSPPFLV